VRKPAPRQGRGMKIVSSSRVAKQPAPRQGRGIKIASAAQAVKPIPRPRRRADPTRSSSSRPGGEAGSLKRVRAELAALRSEWERVAAHVKETVQKIDRLTVAVAELQDEVADLHASLGEGEVDYGPAEEDNSEIGEGHA